MTPKEFATFLESPESSQFSVEQIENLLKQYPYSQSLRIAFLKKLRLSNHPDFEKHLHKTATYAYDRVFLKRYINKEPIYVIEYPAIKVDAEQLETLELIPLDKLEIEKVENSIFDNTPNEVDQKQELTFPSENWEEAVEDELGIENDDIFNEETNSEIEETVEESIENEVETTIEETEILTEETNSEIEETVEESIENEVEITIEKTEILTEETNSEVEETVEESIENEVETTIEETEILTEETNSEVEETVEESIENEVETTIEETEILTEETNSEIEETVEESIENEVEITIEKTEILTEETNSEVEETVEESIENEVETTVEETEILTEETNSEVEETVEESIENEVETTVEETEILTEETVMEVEETIENEVEEIKKVTSKTELQNIIVESKKMEEHAPIEEDIDNLLHEDALEKLDDEIEFGFEIDKNIINNHDDFSLFDSEKHHHHGNDEHHHEHQDEQDKTEEQHHSEEDTKKPLHQVIHDQINETPQHEVKESVETDGELSPDNIFTKDELIEEGGLYFLDMIPKEKEETTTVDTSKEEQEIEPMEHLKTTLTETEKDPEELPLEEEEDVTPSTENVDEIRATLSNHTTDKQTKKQQVKLALQRISKIPLHEIGVITETYGDLLAKQGKIEHAIRLYQQLILKNPQKKVYFAAKIKQLIKKM